MRKIQTKPAYTKKTEVNRVLIAEPSEELMTESGTFYDKIIIDYKTYIRVKASEIKRTKCGYYLELPLSTKNQLNTFIKTHSTIYCDITGVLPIFLYCDILMTKSEALELMAMFIDQVNPNTTIIFSKYYQPEPSVDLHVIETDE